MVLMQCPYRHPHELDVVLPRLDRFQGVNFRDIQFKYQINFRHAPLPVTKGMFHGAQETPDTGWLTQFFTDLPHQGMNRRFTVFDMSAGQIRVVFPFGVT
ncbi:MAG: hypothetical protein A2269_05335 [Lentisphaerae bacterium RIFOXYA12_FULL_60_10]|nr:MAG: hypothetical protein A2269_05335 [Lentisphaerae bacterium RIFOXYA12_FULL_60_10]